MASRPPSCGPETPPPEYLLLTSAPNALNAGDLLQIHQGEFAAQLDSVPVGSETLDNFYAQTGFGQGFALSLGSPQPEYNPGLSPTGQLDKYPGSGPGSSGDSNEKVADPFSPHCKIPLPTPCGPYEYWLDPSFVRRRNERERQRVRNVNEGFERLRNHLPLDGKDRDKRFSKVETLRYAIDYIHHLKDILNEADEGLENRTTPS